LGAFGLESYRERLSEINLKNKLLNQLLTNIREDIDQLKNVQKTLDLTLESSRILLKDHIGSKVKLDKAIIAEKFSDLRTMNISFFPQYGIYKQLLSSNGLENIKDDTLKKKLIYVYESLLMRIAAADPILDEMRWKSYMSLSNEITVIPSEKTKRNLSQDLPLTILEIENYFIGNNYYKSKDVLNFYNQVILYVNQYKSGLKNVNIALDEITLLIKDELKS
jgi:hypothetical protein